MAGVPPSQRKASVPSYSRSSATASSC